MPKFMHKEICRKCGKDTIETREGIKLESFWRCTNARCSNSTNPSNNGKGGPPNWVDEAGVD